MVSVSAKIVLTCIFVNIVLTAKTERNEQNPEVSQFFETTGKVLNNDFESRRRERLLGQEISTSIVELVDIIVRSFNSLAERMPLQGFTNINFEANPQLVKTMSTVLAGMCSFSLIYFI